MCDDRLERFPKIPCGSRAGTAWSPDAGPSPKGMALRNLEKGCQIGTKSLPDIHGWFTHVLTPWLQMRGYRPAGRKAFPGHVINAMVCHLASLPLEDVERLVQHGQRIMDYVQESETPVNLEEVARRFREHDHDGKSLDGHHTVGRVEKVPGRTPKRPDRKEKQTEPHR